MKAITVSLILIVACSCAMPLDQINGDRQTSAVVLKVMPSDAKVYLDGYYIGHASKFDGTHGILRVTPGGHVLKFKAKDFQNEMRELLAREEAQTMTVKMLPTPKPAPEE